MICFPLFYAHLHACPTNLHLVAMDKGTQWVFGSRSSKGGMDPVGPCCEIMSVAPWRKGTIYFRMYVMLQPCPGSIPTWVGRTDKALLCSGGGGSLRLFLRKCLLVWCMQMLQPDLSLSSHGYQDFQMNFFRPAVLRLF